MPQRLAKGDATTHLVTTDATMLQVTEALVATPALLYALIEVTAAGREALAPHLVAVVVTTLPAALDHPLVVALALLPHHGVAARLVAPLLLVVVLEDADSRHF